MVVDLDFTARRNQRLACRKQLARRLLLAQCCEPKQSEFPLPKDLRNNRGLSPTPLSSLKIRIFAQEWTIPLTWTPTHF